jgi:hypothetical protein
MRILVSGSTGLVGSALIPFLAKGGHGAVRLVRQDAAAGGGPAARWDPGAGRIDAAALEGLDAVVHLAGESVASGRWTAAKKERIRRSRVEGTRLLSRTLAGLSRPPRVLACASAIGYYGSRGDEILKEESAPGDDFLAGVCREWEAATEPAAGKGIRVVNLRFGVILSPAGGALAKMLPPFRLGAGGILGDGRQFVSWVAIDDVLGAIQHVLATGSVRGPVNVVSPRPVTNRELTKTLGRVLGRPTILPMPAFAARAVFGEMADALLLASQRVEPKHLVASGYRFRHPDLEGALRHLLGKAKAAA